LDIDFKKDVITKNDYYLWIANSSKHNLKSQLGKSVEIISIKPDTLKFLFENLETKFVPVELDAKITFASGYDMLDKLKTVPDSIRVIGSKSALDQIQNIKTNILNIEEVNSKIEVSMSLIIPEAKSDLKLSQNNVKVIGLVEKFTEGTIEVPVAILNLPENVSINYFPKVVSVSYYVPLSNYKNVKDLDFKVECDYKLINKNTFFTPVLAKIPEEVKSAKIKQNKVEFIILQ
jgi:YbbR domain-containing protein